MHMEKLVAGPGPGTKLPTFKAKIEFAAVVLSGSDQGLGLRLGLSCRWFVDIQAFKETKAWFLTQNGSGGVRNNAV